MADQLQLRRGTTSQNLLFTGAQGEVIVDTDQNSLVVHNGVTPGGFPVATGQQLKDGTFYYNEDIGSASDAYILTPKANTNAPNSYLDGIQFGFVTTHANTGASTANFFGLGVKNLKYPGGVDPLAGEIFGRVYLIYDAANGWLEIQRKASGPPPQLRSIGASVSSSNLTFTLNPCTIDFRSTVIGSGVVNVRNVTSQLSLTVPNGATLGTTSNTSARLVLLAIYGPSNVELAVSNLAGGVILDETVLINTVAISAASGTAGTVYSAVARASVPYRVLGFIDITQVTAGAWNTAPATIQGGGGLALAATSSVGYGQNWQTVIRALGTTYTNTTGKPIMVNITFAASGASFVTGQLSINGSIQATSGTTPNVTTSNCSITGVIIPPGATYSATIASGSGILSAWTELR